MHSAAPSIATTPVPPASTAAPLTVVPPRDEPPRVDPPRLEPSGVVSPGAAPSSLARPPELNGGGLRAAVRVALRAAHWLEEVESGRRPATGLRRLLLPPLAARWQLAARKPRPPGRFLSMGPVQLRRRQPVQVCNVVLLFEHDGRTLPLAMELVLRDRCWFVSSVDRPGMASVPSLPTGWDAALDDAVDNGWDCQPSRRR